MKHTRFQFESETFDDYNIANENGVGHGLPPGISKPLEELK
jgi:hypothetical protein